MSMEVKLITDTGEKLYVCQSISVTKFPTIFEPKREGIEVELTPLDGGTFITLRLPEDGREIYAARNRITIAAYRWPPQGRSPKPAPASAASPPTSAPVAPAAEPAPVDPAGNS